MSNIKLKTEGEIQIMKKAGSILGEALSEVLSKVKPGVSEIELDRMADKLIREKGGEPGFKKVYDYKFATCISVNEEVVHGIPGERILKENDIVCIDCGVYLDGFHTDMAETVKVKNKQSFSSNKQSLGSDDPEKSKRSHSSFLASSKIKSLKEEEIDKFLDVGKLALEKAIKVAIAGNRVGNISKTMQGIVEGGGYSIVGTLVGHGIGKDLHEAPEIPCFLARPIDKTPLLKKGMTIAVEVIYTMGKGDVVYEGSDDWTIISKDKSMAAVFERTILITESEPMFLTKLN